MRPIKFRAWSNKWNKMIYPDNKDISIDVHSNTAWDDTIDDECIELMQYTSLHDKNGKEVYEDDIVKDKDGNVYKIVWSQVSFKMEGKKEIIKMFDRIGEFITVIGNKYENPELIE